MFSLVAQCDYAYVKWGQSTVKIQKFKLHANVLLSEKFRKGIPLHHKLTFGTTQTIQFIESGTFSCIVISGDLKISGTTPFVLYLYFRTY